MTAPDMKKLFEELNRLPFERRKAIVEGFNTSPETAALRERLGKLPFRLAAVLAMLVIGVMVLVYNLSIWLCTAAGLLCFIVGIPVGTLLSMALYKRALKRYLQKSSTDAN